MVWLDTLGLISGDSHVNEPRRLWSDNLPASLRSQALRGIAPGSDGNWELVYGGPAAGCVRGGGARSHEDGRTAAPVRGDARGRGRGECIYPTIGLYVWMLHRSRGGGGVMPGLQRVDRRRIGPLAALQVRRADPDVASVEDASPRWHWVADSRAGCLDVPAVASPDWNHRSWEPLWSAIEETGLPAVMHQGTGHSMYFYRGPGAGVSNLVATQSMAPRTATLLATSGVLGRPSGSPCRVRRVQRAAGWRGPWTPLDFYTKSFARYGYSPEGKKWINPELPELPSYYMRRQVHATFQDDPVGDRTTSADTGPAALIWGSDYPHEEGTYPHSRETVARLAEGLDSPDDIERSLRTNAAELFHFSEEVLARPV